VNGWWVRGSRRPRGRTALPERSPAPAAAGPDPRTGASHDDLLTPEAFSDGIVITLPSGRTDVGQGCGEGVGTCAAGGRGQEPEGRPVTAKTVPTATGDRRPATGDRRHHRAAGVAQHRSASTQPRPRTVGPDGAHRVRRIPKVGLPVPGGPKSMPACGARTPCSSARAAWDSGRRTRRSIGDFSAAIPWTCCHKLGAGTAPPNAAAPSTSPGRRCSRFSNQTMFCRSVKPQLRKA